MATILNMENLRDIIDHDQDLERELVNNFHTCYQICISELEAAIASNDNVLWRNASHALKGIAFNLGAESLGDLSLKSEQSSEVPSPEKIELLEKLKQGYTAVSQQLKLTTKS
jgi:HPt (histidine-containing phosphotransfer) domain-containing protein